MRRRTCGWWPYWKRRTPVGSRWATTWPAGGVEVYRVSGQVTAAQRKVYQRIAKSDKVDARVLARLFLTIPDRLLPVYLPDGQQLTLQSLCREQRRLSHQIATIKCRLQDYDKFAWLGLKEILPPYELTARWLREHFYSPWAVLEAGEPGLQAAWLEHNPSGDTAWIAPLIHKAAKVAQLFGSPARIDYPHLQELSFREQQQMGAIEERLHYVRIKRLRPLYRQLYPQRHLESLYGIDQDSAAVFIAFIGDILRFPTLAQFRSWSGLIPYSSQTGEMEAKGMHITQTGPDLIKSTAFLDAEIARLYDPQIAAIYYDQMVSKGKHHLQAVCACATHLLNRIYVVLRENRPYQLRNVDGAPLTKPQARQICQALYRVPQDVRKRNNARTRRAREAKRAEQRFRRAQENKRSKG